MQEMKRLACDNCVTSKSSFSCMWRKVSPASAENLDLVACTAVHCTASQQQMIDMCICMCTESTVQRGLDMEIELGGTSWLQNIRGTGGSTLRLKDTLLTIFRFTIPQSDHSPFEHPRIDVIENIAQS